MVVFQPAGTLTLYHHMHPRIEVNGQSLQVPQTTIMNLLQLHIIGTLLVAVVLLITQNTIYIQK